MVTYCIDHFVMYRKIESLCCTPETNIARKKKMCFAQLKKYPPLILYNTILFYGEFSHQHATLLATLSYLSDEGWNQIH